ncbi:MAG TPA: potassium channel family protein [Candidatus Binatia bacterium]|jgi:hypothetical protein|nr:potassium channel family protein [Candidatus Binatia bacterium]
MSNHDPDAVSRSRRALRAVRSHVQPGSFPVLLVAIGLLYVLNGSAVTSTAGGVLVFAARIGVLFAGIYVLSGTRVTMWLAVFVGALALALEGRVLALDSHVTRVVQDGVTAGFLLWILYVVLGEVFRATTTERAAVIGALCGFMIILTIFTRLHGLIEASFPGAYHGDDPPFAERSDETLVANFQYFSTVTLTTVGFGDIVPVAPVARLATGVEAIVGQLYLAVVIATLVGRAAGSKQ